MISDTSDTIDVREFINRTALNSYQIMLIGLCVLTLFIDGFEAQAIAVAAHDMSRALNLNARELSVIFSIAYVGGAAGGLLLAPLADRMGRRPLILATVLGSAVMTLCFPLAGSFEGFAVLRFFSGILLASQTTIVIAYVGEIVPHRVAGRSVVFTTAGYGLGVAATGFLSAWFIPAFGWQSLYLLGGTIAGVTGLLLVFILPESPRHLAQHPSRQAELRAFLARVNPAGLPTEGTIFHLEEEVRAGVKYVRAFQQGRALATIALCSCTFLINFVIYNIMQWLPTLMQTQGAATTQAGFSIGWFKAAGIVGSLLCGYMIDRSRRPYFFLAAFLLFSTVELMFLKSVPFDGTIFIPLMALLGFLLAGPQNALVSLAAMMFPTYVRSTGVALLTAGSRLGAMVGPLVVGELLMRGWTGSDLLQAAAIPTTMLVCIVMLLSILHRTEESK